MLFLLNELPYPPPALTEKFVLLTILRLVQSPITSLSHLILTPGNAVNGLGPSTLHFQCLLLPCFKIQQQNYFNEEMESHHHNT